MSSLTISHRQKLVRERLKTATSFRRILIPIPMELTQWPCFFSIIKVHS